MVVFVFVFVIVLIHWVNIMPLSMRPDLMPSLRAEKKS